MKLQLQSVRKSYFLLGAPLLLMMIPALWFGLRGTVMPSVHGTTLWQIATGTVLLTAFGYQWLLFAARWRKDANLTRVRYKWHKYVGVAMTLLFLAHAASFGYALTSMLALCFIANAVAGLLNPEVLQFQHKLARTVWLVLHVGLSAAMVPLVLLHVWAALAFK